MEKCFLELPTGGLRFIPQCVSADSKRRGAGIVTGVAVWEVRSEPSLTGAGWCRDTILTTSLETLPSKTDFNMMEKAPSCLPNRSPQRVVPKANLSPAAAQGSPPAPTNIPVEPLWDLLHSTWAGVLGSFCRSTPNIARHPADSCFLCELSTILQFLGTVNELNSFVIHLRDLINSKL